MVASVFALRVFHNAARDLVVLGYNCTYIHATVIEMLPWVDHAAVDQHAMPRQVNNLLEESLNPSNLIL